MKKYWFIIKMQIMSNLQYIFNIVFGFIGYFIMLFILFQSFHNNIFSMDVSFFKFIATRVYAAKVLLP